METSLGIDDPVKSFVKNNPRCAKVFEELNIDFCCGGDTSLLNACEEEDLEPHWVYQRLVELQPAPSTREKDVSDLTLTELTEHLESTHHVYLKKALPRLVALMDKVHQAHSPRHPELTRLQTVVENLRADLEPHLLKEEQILFPLIRQLEAEGLQLEAAQGPIRVMRSEHDGAGDLLKEMRTLTNVYVVPKDGCQSFQLLYEGLKELEEDTHLHIYKENNMLFR
jgi:regulator of cell morphogenesis and NO signaling